MEIERKHGVSAGMQFRLSARVDVRSRDGRVMEAMMTAM